MTNIIRARVVPAALELVDGESLEAVARPRRAVARARGHGRDLLIEVDGVRLRSRRKPARVERPAAKLEPPRSCAREDEAERAGAVANRREMSLSLRMIAPLKFNHDVVVPKGRIPELFAAGRATAARVRLGFRASATPATAISTSNTMLVTPRTDALPGARAAKRVLFEGGRGARGVDQRGTWNRIRQGAVLDRAVARRDRAHQASEAGVPYDGS